MCRAMGMLITTCHPSQRTKHYRGRGVRASPASFDRFRSVPREHLLSRRSEGDDIITLGLHSRHFHTGRPQWHPCHRKTLDSLWTRRERALHIGDGYMAFERHAIDDRRVAGGERSGNADPRL
jgi:hypothetical protein